MTNQFKGLSENLAKEDYTPIAPMAETSQVQAICLYQIATTMIEVEKTLKNILIELRKRKV